MLYRIEQRIHTLAENVVDHAATGRDPAFTAEGITFSPWKVEPSDGYWTHRYWLATSEIEAENFQRAWGLLWDRLARIVPRISLVTQCYIEYLTQPILILRNNSETAFFRYVVEQEGVGLSFMDEEHKALEILLKDTGIPNEFFWYWNDATNSSGYTPKLVLMLAAVETLVNKKDDTGKYKLNWKDMGLAAANRDWKKLKKMMLATVKTLVKKRNDEGRHNRDWKKLKRILGKDLAKDFFWGENGLTDDALRNRLIHGRYFGPQHGEKHHVNMLHQRIVAYFNREIFGEELIAENVVNPQRHPFGNRALGQSWIQAEDGASLTLPLVLVDSDQHGNFTHYKRVVDHALWETY